MEAIDAILSRRSIRRYKRDAVPDHILEQVLKAAMAAPSAGNEQPWEFVVIRDRGTLDKIPSMHPYSRMVKDSPLAVLVCGDLDRAVHGDMWIQDCSAATENLLIAIHALGMGAVWLGVYPREDRMKGLKDLLLLPERIIPFALVPMGYPAETKPPSKRFKRARIHYETW